MVWGRDQGFCDNSTRAFVMTMREGSKIVQNCVTSFIDDPALVSKSLSGALSHPHPPTISGIFDNCHLAIEIRSVERYNAIRWTKEMPPWTFVNNNNNNSGNNNNN
jgi:hypothetical protein